MQTGFLKLTSGHANGGNSRNNVLGVHLDKLLLGISVSLFSGLCSVRAFIDDCGNRYVEKLSVLQKSMLSLLEGKQMSWPSWRWWGGGRMNATG